MSDKIASAAHAEATNRKQRRAADRGLRRRKDAEDKRVAEDIYRNTIARVLHGDPTP